MSVRIAYWSPSFTSPMATPATGDLSGTPASINASEAPQTVAMDDDPLDSRMSETTRIAYGQGPVPDLAAACTAQKCNFAHREWREVVVQHKALLGLAFEYLQALHVIAGAQSGCDQGLRFAAGEDGRAMGTGQHAHFHPDGADFIERSSIWTPFLLDDFVAENAFPQNLVIGFQFFLGGFVLFGKGCHQALAKFLHQRVAFGLRVLLGVEAVRQVGPDSVLQVVVICLVKFRRSDGALGFPRLVAQFIDGCTDFLDLGVCELNGIDDGFFFDFLGAGLDHHDAVGGAHNHDVEQAVAHLAVGRIDDELPVDQSHPHRADRPHEGNI